MDVALGLIPIRKVGCDSRRKHMVLCRCRVCSGETTVRSDVVRRAKSCGCATSSLLAAAAYTHGCSNTAEYRAWKNMRLRCYDQRDVAYARYGGRGITVCDQWRASFENFLADVGQKPSPSHSLDRIDNDGNYEPGNVRWASKKEQQRNRSNARLLTYQGRTQTVAAWAEELGFDQDRLYARLNKGMSPEQALSTPVLKRKPIGITHNGRTQSVSAWAREFGVNQRTLAGRLARGMPLSQACTPPALKLR